jgi:hypothetical protein
MARDSEKKDHMFARWQNLKKSDDLAASGKDVDNRRPFLSSECNSCEEAEKWHRSIVSEIRQKIVAVENASIGEYRLKEINDEINKLVRTKNHWEKRIKELGGNINNIKRYHFEIDGEELPGSRGYKYYGACKNLPGIRELFEQGKLTLDIINLNKKKRLIKSELINTIYQNGGTLNQYLGIDYFPNAFFDANPNPNPNAVNSSKSKGKKSNVLNSDANSNANKEKEKDILLKLKKEEAEKEKILRMKSIEEYNENQKIAAAAISASTSTSGSKVMMIDDGSEESKVDVLSLAIEANNRMNGNVNNNNATSVTTNTATTDNSKDAEAVIMEAKKQELLKRFNF